MYYLFAGDSHYPCGGVHDFVGKYNTLEAATPERQEGRPLKWVPSKRYDRWKIGDFSFDWWHVTDTDFTIVAES